MKITRRLISVFIVVFLILNTITFVSAVPAETDVAIDGKVIAFQNPAITKDGVCFVPLAEFCGYLDIQLEVDDYDTGAYVSDGIVKAWVQNDNIFAKINSENFQMEGSPFEEGEIFYVPLSFIGTAFNYTLEGSVTDGLINLRKLFNFRFDEKTAGHINSLFPDKNSLNPGTESAYDILTMPNNTLTDEAALYVKADLSELVGKEVTSLVFTFSATRNYNGSGAFNIYNVTSDWDSSDISFNNKPAEGSLLATKTFSSSFPTGSERNPFPDSSTYAKIELDISGALDTLTAENPWVSLRIEGVRNSTSTENSLRMHGVKTPNAPQITAMVKSSAQFTVRNPNVNKAGALDANGFKKINMLAKLGFFSDGDQFPADTDQPISRAEFVHYAVKLLSLSIPAAEDPNPFADVTSDHYLYDSIAFAHVRGFVNGMGDGTFEPDAVVKHNEAMTVLCNIMGASEIAKSLGGYPTGYLRAAQQLELLNKINISGEKELSYAEVCTLIYNALTTEMSVEVSYGEEKDFRIKNDSTPLLEIMFEVRIVKDIVTANNFTGLNDASERVTGGVRIGKKEYSITNDSYNELLGCYSEAVYQIENDEIIYMGALANRNQELILTSSEISGSADAGGGAYTVSYEQEGIRNDRKINIKADMAVIYNNTALDKENELNAKILDPYIGNLRFLDHDGDGEYDVVFVESGRSIVVSNIDMMDHIIYARNNPSGRVELHPEDEHFAYSIKDVSGNLFTYDQLKEGDTLTVMENTTGNPVHMMLSRKVLEGTVNRVDAAADRKSNLTIDGVACTHIEGMGVSVALGDTGTFYLDAYNNIAGTDLIGDALRFGYITGINETNNLSGDINLQIFTKSSNSHNIPVYALAERVTVNDTKLTKTEAYAFLAPDGIVNRQVICFKVGSDRKIREILTATTDSAADSSKLVERYKSGGDMRYRAPYMGGLYGIDTNKTFVITVPDDPTDKAGYSVAATMANDADYTVGVYTMGHDKIIADVLVLHNYSLGSKVSLSSGLSIVKGTVSVVADGEMRTRLDVVTNGVEKSVTVADAEVSTVQGFRTGDVIRFSTNSDGELSSAIKYYDRESKTISNLVGAFNAATHVNGGFIYYKEDGFIRIARDFRKTTDDQEGVMVLDYATAADVAYKYDARDDTLNVSKAAYDELIDYRSGGRLANGIITQTSYGSTYRSIILVELDSFGQSDDDLENDIGFDVQTMAFESEGFASVSVSKKVGTSYTLPSELFAKPLYKLIAWDDGVSQYPVGSKYTVPMANTTFTAVWERTGSGTFALPVTEDNAALTMKAPIDSFGGAADYPEYSGEAVDGNLIGTHAISGADHADGLNNHNTVQSKLWYKVDATELIGSHVNEAKLIVHMRRNYAGVGNINAYEVTGEWDANSITSATIPTYNTAPLTSLPIASIFDPEGTGVNNSDYLKVELDITAAAQKVTTENPWISVMLASTNTSTNLMYLVKSTNSAIADQRPAMEVTVGEKEGFTLSFAGGEGAVGTTVPIIAKADTSVTLPDCGFTNAGYAFGGWSDGANTYAPGDSYTMPASDTTLTAVWNFSGTVLLPITEGNGALTMEVPLPEPYFSKPDPGHRDNYRATYHTDGNLIGLHVVNNDHVDGLSGGDRASGKLWYKVDAGEFAGSTIEEAKLVVYVRRNYGGDGSFGVYEVTQDWDASTISYENMPTYNATPITSLASTSVFNPDGTGTNNTDYIKVELDITEAAQNITAENPWISVMFTNDITSKDCMYLVNSINTADQTKQPVIEIKIGE